MNSITICVGIDVSKDRLDVQVPGLKYFSIENSRQGEPLRGRGYLCGTGSDHWLERSEPARNQC